MTFFLLQRISCRQSITIVVYLRQWCRIFLSIITVLLFRCWFRQDSSVRVAGRVLPDNYGVIVVLRCAQRRRRHPVSGMQQFCQFFCKYNTAKLQPQMCANRFSKCIVSMIFVLFYRRRLNTVDLLLKTFNDHYNVFLPVSTQLYTMAYTISMQPVDNKLADILKEINNNKISGVSEKKILGVK